MGVRLKYVRRLPSGRLEYRRVFPAKLRPFVGRQELIRSLEADSLAEPGAMERYRAANDNFERLASTAHKAVSSSFDNLDGPRIAWLAEAYKANILSNDERLRVLGKADRECHEANELGYQSVLEDSTGPQIREMFEEDALAIAAEEGWHLDTRSEPFAALCRELLKALLKATEVQLARDNGVVVDTPRVAPVPKALAAAAAVRKLQSFASIVEEEMARPTFNGGASTKQSWKTALRYLGEVHGELAPLQAPVPRR